MICNECETVAHCAKHGCVPKVSAKDAITQAINALNCIEYGSFCINDGPSEDTTESAITALRSALAEQPAQQEPVAWKHDCAALLTNNVELWIDRCPHCGKPCTSPPAQRKPLTDEEIIKCWGQVSGTRYGYVAFARAIEAAHGITKGNT